MTALNRGQMDGDSLRSTVVIIPLHRLLLLCAALTGPALAQNQPPAKALAPLTKVSELHALSAAESQQSQRPVKLRGVTLFVGISRDGLTLHDGTGSIGVQLQPGLSCPAQGDEVEIEGYSSSISLPGGSYPRAFATAVRVIGRKALPEPRKSTIQELGTFKHYDQWVFVEGVVTAYMYMPPTLTVEISGPDGWVKVHVRNWPVDGYPKDLFGAHIRATGINMGYSHTNNDAMMVPTPAQFEVLRPGTEDPFGASVFSIKDVVAKKVPDYTRVKVRGTIVATPSKQILYVRGDGAAVCANLLYPWSRNSIAGAQFSDAGPWPSLKVGDEVELAGSVFAAGVDPAFSLPMCHVRLVGSGPPPEPLRTTLSAIAGGQHTHDLVEVTARLLDKKEVPIGNGGYRTTLMLNANGVTLPAGYQSRSRDLLDHLKIDDDLLIRGVVDNATVDDPRQLWVSQPGDVRSLGLSSAVRLHRIWLWGGSAIASVLLLGVWVITLRRSLRRQRQADLAMRELNATLERRVQERTGELERAQHELNLALEQERELGELKSRFVTMVSHEFRTPLGIIMSAVELMRHYDERLPNEQRRELCNDIYGATRLMASLMEQVLVLGRVEAGKLGCRALPLDLNLLAEKIADELHSATNRTCLVQWQPEGSLAGAVADEALLRHIFGNLISNAIKYSPDGRNVEFTARRDGTEAVFQVIDHGIGIPAEDQARLFEAFYRCSNVGEIPGTGLGLVIVKRCVDLHGGTLAIDSEIGRGTTFTVRLPLFKIPQE